MYACTFMNIVKDFPMLTLCILFKCDNFHSKSTWQGRIQDSEKGGGAQFCYCEHGNCVQSTQSGMQSIPNLGGSGGMPPQKILKN